MKEVADGLPESTSEESVESSGVGQLPRQHSYHHSTDASDEVLLADYDQSSYEGVSALTLESTLEFSSTHNVLDNHISPAHTAQDRTHTAISHVERPASAAENLSNASIAGWHASPTSNPRSPFLTKKSPLETLHNHSPFTNSAFSPSSQLTLRWPASNAYEASLIHHYVVYCTNWIDVCDSRKHFEKEVPKRAAHFPVILNGILGLSARHTWLMGKTPEDHSQPYVDQCLQALIVALEDPLCHWDENFLVAVILLRLHEEMGDADEQCHHFGTWSFFCCR